MHQLAPNGENLKMLMAINIHLKASSMHKMVCHAGSLGPLTSMDRFLRANGPQMATWTGGILATMDPLASIWAGGSMEVNMVTLLIYQQIGKSLMKDGTKMGVELKLEEKIKNLSILNFLMLFFKNSELIYIFKS